VTRSLATEPTRMISTQTGMEGMASTALRRAVKIIATKHGGNTAIFLLTPLHLLPRQALAIGEGSELRVSL